MSQTPKDTTASPPPISFPTRRQKTNDKYCRQRVFVRDRTLQLRNAMPESKEHNRKPENRCGHRITLGLVSNRTFLVSDHSRTWEAGIKEADIHSELLPVLLDLSRSCFSVLACCSSSGTRRRLELMNQLLIYPPLISSNAQRRKQSY